LTVFFVSVKLRLSQTQNEFTHMTRRSQLTALLILAGAFHSGAGTLSYVAVSPVQSDINCGIDSRNQYTTAVDGGNTSGNDRVINGVRLYSLVGAGQSASADNCTLNALTGTLGNSQRSGAPPQADGIFAEVLSDMVSNDGASDNSQQEIVLDPASLAAGTTYDLRIYIANSDVQDREVNLAFVGDGQAAVETGFFNEEDARTSPGAFRDPNQVYYIDYRFTWDGASTPGVTITQKSGQAPFALYALTNQPVIEETAAAPAAPAVPVPAAATTALVSAVPDQVGVTSDTFYSNQSLKKHGRWIEVKKYGRCWQPTDSPPDWRPYSRGHFGYSDDGGYVWISDQSENEWGWATYHYGRWCRVPGVGSGWAWVPGTAWSGGWVSWRQGRDHEHAFVGWAPLPPEATLRVGVGISTWADREYDIGPDYYTFVNVRDFGSDSYWRPGLIVDRRRYVDILPHTVNITNINYTDTHGNVSNVSITQVRAYNGGPDFTFINTQIRQNGGREISRIQVDRVGTENFNGGIGSRLQGNTFVVFTPQVTAQPNPRVLPKVMATVPDNKIDHGWAELKDQKLKTQLRNEIAQQAKGQTPETTKAVLPAQVIQAAAQSAATTAAPGQSPQAPGVTTIPTASPSATAANQIAGAVSTAPATTSPASSPLQSPAGAVASTSASPAASQPAVVTKGLHPGEKLTSPAVATGRATASPAGPTPAASGAAVTSALSAEAQQSATPKILHPGAKVESKPTQSPAVATNVASPSPTVGAAQSPAGRGQHPGEKIVSAPGQSPAPIKAASPTPSKPAAVTTTQGSPSPAVGLHPGAKIAPTPAQSAAPAVTGTSASPVVPTQQSPARNVQTQRNQLTTPPPAQTPRGAVTAASPSPTAAPTRPVVGRQNQQRGQAETKPPVTPTPSQAQLASTPAQLPVTTARTPARSVETVQTPPPVQTPAVTKKVTAPAVTRESTSPSPSGPSQQQRQQQQIEERIRQQQQQKQQEQAEQKLQQQQGQQRQQQQLEQEQKLKLQEQKQAQQKAEQAQAKQQEAAQQKESQLQQQKQQQLQQQQAEQKKESQLQAQKQQEAAQQKEHQLQQQKQQEAQQKQAEQKRELQMQAQKEAAQQKERQAQQLKDQQAQQRQQELKQEQARQKAEQQQQLKQQQLQQQAEQRQQQQLQQQAQQQQQRQQQQMQSQQQNRRAATPTPSPSQ
jgi:hypothetical protein